MSNLIAELSLHTMWHATRDVVRDKRSMCCTWFAHNYALAIWVYMLETVRGTVRKLSKISNCAFECDYLLLLLFISFFDDRTWCTPSLRCFGLSWNFKHPWYNKADPYYLLTRQEQVTVFTLRTGHNRLNYNLYSKFRIGHTEQCPCGTGSQTTEHLLQSCPIYEPLRKGIWPDHTPMTRKLYRSLRDLRCTATFIEETGVSIWRRRRRLGALRFWVFDKLDAQSCSVSITFHLKMASSCMGMHLAMSLRCFLQVAFYFFFFCILSSVSGVHHFWRDFYVCDCFLIQPYR